MVPLTHQRTFLPSLEAARGVAAFWVCGLHALLYWTRFRAPALDNHLMDFFIGIGNSAVSFFFVLSGYVLTLSLDRMASQPAPARTVRFILARAFRIYPAALVAVIGYAVLEPDWIFKGLPNRSLWDIVQNALLITASMDRPTWSTRVEIVAIPVILIGWHLRVRYGARALAGLGLVLAAGAFWQALYANDPIGHNLFMFVAGMLIADSSALFRRLRLWQAIPLALAALAAAIAVRAAYNGHGNQWMYLVEGACCFFLVGLIAYEAAPTGWLRGRMLRFLGRVSYSFYLIHFIVIFVLLRHPPALAIGPLAAAHWTVATLAVWMFVTLLSLGLAWLLYWLVELPGIRAGRALAAAMFEKKRPAAETIPLPAA